MKRRPDLPMVAFDPAGLGDPVATTTAWTPLRKGGSNICLHRLTSRGPDRLAFRPTVFGALYPLLILGLGGAVTAAIPGLPVADAHYLYALAMMVIIGPVAILYGLRELWWVFRPRVFDRHLGTVSMGGAVGTFELAKVHALQIITEVCTSKSTRYFSYELNLVFGDGQRRNLVDHGDLPHLREDAATLAAFAGVPLWDPR